MRDRLQITRMDGFKTARPLDRDKLSMTPRPEATRVALAAMDRVQHETPEKMVLGVATLFAAVCRRCSLDPAAVYSMATKVLDAPEEGDRATDASVQVMRDFVGAKVMGKEVTIG